jgi:aspartate kinase
VINENVCSMRIFKFGGASVKNVDGVINILSIISQFLDQKLVIVVSAMGKTTNALEDIAHAAYGKKDFESKLEELKSYHDKICYELFEEVPVRVLNLWVQLKATLDQPDQNWHKFYDATVSYGELLSTTIVQLYLSKHFDSSWVDARRYIRTNNFYTEALVDWKLTGHYINKDFPRLLQKGPIVTQGFIGADFTGQTTTLGREGSDFSGAIFAYCLDAESLTVWKDVPGLLNADPKRFSSAELFDELSFQEVTELTYYGAKVIHPKTIRPLAQKGIPLYVRSFLNPKESGTMISEQDKVASKPCYVFKENQLLVTLRVRDNSFMDEKKMLQIFQALDRSNIKINMMHSSALTFTFCMDFQKHKLDEMGQYLSEEFQLLYNEGLELATIKNYQEDSFDLLEIKKEIILEQKTRNTYQVVYRLKD